MSSAQRRAEKVSHSSRRCGYLVALSCAFIGCSPIEPVARTPERPAPPVADLRATDPEVGTQPLIDFVPAAGLRWALVLDPTRLLPVVQHAAPELLPPARVQAFAQGVGVELNEAQQIVIANYGTSTLYLIRAPHSATQIHQRLSLRMHQEPKRDQRESWPRELDGVIGKTPVRLLAWDPDTSACAVGNGVPAQAAWLFARGRLERSPSALRGSSLQALGPSSDAPFRLYVTGPLDEQLAISDESPLKRLQAAEIQLSFSSDAERVRFWMQMIGDWPQAMIEHWCTWFEHITGSGSGALLGLDRGVEACHAVQDGDRVELTTSWDAADLIGSLDAVLNLRLDAVLDAPAPDPESPSSTEPAGNSH